MMDTQEISRLDSPVDDFREVLLGVWREACQHTEIQECTGNLATLLAKQLPIEGLLVRRSDDQHHAMDTVAAGHFERGAWMAPLRSLVPAARWKRVTAWLEDGSVLHGRAGQRDDELSLIVPREISGEVLVGPLRNGSGPTGALIAVVRPGATFWDTHRAMFELLLEPFSAALENDRRLHELKTLREAAEADRRSLLSRLGRQEVNEAIVGAETGLRHVMERVELVASSDLPVLILGETGTGKEVVSRAIHTRSPRWHGPFIRVNCGAIPAELIDSQLFGHERGSFTGASDTRKGWFERADGGTLFLDEIGELPLPAQVRLLRVLQDSLIERVGAQQSLRVDVRIVAATHRDLASMVKAGTFREDLWYRINVFPLLLPRLRERREDIPELARHFAQRAAHRFGLAYVEPSIDDLQLLQSYAWPGNIRELGAVIDRAAILGGGKCLDVAKALGFSRVPSEPVSQEPTFYEVVPEDLPRLYPLLEPSVEVVSLDAAMKQHIERALVTTRGRIEGKHGAAALLRINPHTLRARMRKLGISWSRFRKD